MGFLAPNFLFLISLASIPLIIHLLQRIRLKKVNYSSLFFLTATKRETFSWFQIKEILLLIFRTLFIFFLFFTLARPYLRGARIIHTRQEASRVIILDDSYSMGYQNNFSQAKLYLKNLITELKSGSEAAILTPSNNYKMHLTSDLFGLGKIADTIAVSFSGNTLAQVFEDAKALLVNSSLPLKEIYIITDLQKHAAEQLIDKNIGKNSIPVTIIDVGQQNQENVGIEQIALSSNFPLPDLPVKPKVIIKNYSAKSVTRSLKFSIKFSERESVMQNIKTDVSLGPKETKTVQIDAEIRGPGIYRAEASITNDALVFDDHRYFAINVPEQIPILLLYETPSDIQYVEKALKISNFNITTAPVNTLRQENLKRYKAIGLFSSANLNYADWQRLGFYLLDGGGLFIAIDKEMKEPQWTGALNLDFSLDGKEVAVKSPGFITIGQVDLASPVMDIFKDIDMSPVKFYSYWALNNIPAGAILASFSTGNPFLIEPQNKNLIIALTSFAADNTDFMLKATFLPLFHRIFSYLASPMLVSDFQVGDTISSRVAQVGYVKIKTPSGEDLQMPTAKQGKLIVKYSDTKQPGFYQIGNEVISVNVLAEEGDLTRIAEQELKAKNMKVINNTLGKTTDISGFALALSILFFILELVLLVV